MVSVFSFLNGSAHCEMFWAVAPSSVCLEEVILFAFVSALSQWKQVLQ